MKNKIVIMLYLGITAVLSACTTSIANQSDSSEYTHVHALETEIEQDDSESLNFTFGIGPLFGSVTKSTLANFTDVENFLGKIEMERHGKVDSTQLVFISNYRTNDVRYSGLGRRLTEEQKEMLKRAPIGSSFCISTYFEPSSEEAREKGLHIYHPHFTVVPKTQATYVFGFQAVCDYLRETVKNDMQKVREEKLTSGKVFFTVSESGQIENIAMTHSCGFPSIDDKVMKALSIIPGNWIPAKNENGNSVSQELVFTYGRPGC